MPSIRTRACSPRHHLAGVLIVLERVNLDPPRRDFERDHLLARVDHGLEQVGDGILCTLRAQLVQGAQCTPSVWRKERKPGELRVRFGAANRVAEPTHRTQNAAIQEAAAASLRLAELDQVASFAVRVRSTDMSSVDARYQSASAKEKCAAGPWQIPRNKIPREPRM